MVAAEAGVIDAHQIAAAFVGDPRFEVRNKPITKHGMVFKNLTQHVQASHRIGRNSILTKTYYKECFSSASIKLGLGYQTVSYLRLVMSSRFLFRCGVVGVERPKLKPQAIADADSSQSRPS